MDFLRFKKPLRSETKDKLIFSQAAFTTAMTLKYCCFQMNKIGATIEWTMFSDFLQTLKVEEL